MKQTILEYLEKRKTIAENAYFPIIKREDAVTAELNEIISWLTSQPESSPSPSVSAEEIEKAAEDLVKQILKMTAPEYGFNDFVFKQMISMVVNFTSHYKPSPKVSAEGIENVIRAAYDSHKDSSHIDFIKVAADQIGRYASNYKPSPSQEETPKDIWWKWWVGMPSEKRFELSLEYPHSSVFEIYQAELSGASSESKGGREQWEEGADDIYKETI